MKTAVWSAIAWIVLVVLTRELLLPTMTVVLAAGFWAAWNRPVHKPRSRAWHETPREQVTRRSRYIEAETKLAVYRKSDGRCVACGSRENLQVDHIIPWSKSGSNKEPNLQLLCDDCNQAKSDRLRMPMYVETGD